jgi:hypothetical protein
VAKKDPPRQIGRYEIRRELGRGVMGVVYQAWDTILGRTIALKTIKPVADSLEQGEAWERRFLIEAQAAARLSHPAIVVVYDVGRDPDTDVLYIALEYLEGQSLAQKSGSGRPLPWREALRIVGQVAEGLHHAHTQGVIHRDIKPANVMVMPSGDAKILDFGVARLDEGSLTNPGDLCGTPLYMSPEQASGHPLDARSDIFSLGAVAWTILTGQSPFDAPTVSAILMRVLHRTPPPPSELASGIPKEVDEIVARALAKMPEDRYPDAHQLAEDVEDALAGRALRHRAEWNPTASGERTRVSLAGRDEDLPALPLAEEVPATRKPRRRRGRVWLGAALLLGLATAAFLHFRAHPENRAFWVDLAGRAATSAPARSLHDWLGTFSSATPPAAGAATAGLEASPAPVLAATPGTLLPSSAPGAADEAPPAESAVTTEPPPGEPPPAAPAPSGAAATEPATSTPSSETPQGHTPAAGTAEVAVAAPSPAAPSPTAPPVATSAAEGKAGVQTPGPSPPPARPRARKPSAYLSVGFQHRLKSGTLEVWLDGTRVASEKLDSRVAKKMLLFELRKGSVEQTLPLEPGRHEVRVRVRSGGDTKSARTSALFRAEATRRLEISLSRLSGSIALEWR